jgi:hypothetical protein
MRAAGMAPESYQEYLIASFTLDANRVARYYNEPFMLVTAASSLMVANRAETEKCLHQRVGTLP